MYLMRTVLHDWNDASCIAILSNLRRAMGDAKATLTIAEVTCTCMRTPPPGHLTCVNGAC